MCYAPGVGYVHVYKGNSRNINQYSLATDSFVYLRQAVGVGYVHTYNEHVNNPGM